MLGVVVFNLFMQEKQPRYEKWVSALQNKSKSLEINFSYEILYKKARHRALASVRDGFIILKLSLYFIKVVQIFWIINFWHINQIAAIFRIFYFYYITFIQSNGSEDYVLVWCRLQTSLATEMQKYFRFTSWLLI